VIFHIDLGFLFVISSPKCGGLLFVVLCGVVWFPFFLRCSFDSYWRIDYSIKDLGVNVADPEAMDFPVTLILSYIFVDIMSLYAINLDAVSLFTDSSFTFLAVLNDVISRFEWMNIILFFVKKKSWLSLSHPYFLNREVTVSKGWSFEFSSYSR